MNKKRWSGSEAGPELVRLGAGDAVANRVVARTDGLCRMDGRRALGRNLGPLDTRGDHGLHRRPRQPALGCGAHRRYHSEQNMTTMVYFVAGKLTLSLD